MCGLFEAKDGSKVFMPRVTEMLSSRAGLKNGDDPDRLYARRPNSACRQHFFSYRVVNVWNAIRKEVKQVVSAKLFRARLLKDGSNVFVNSRHSWSSFVSCV